MNDVAPEQNYWKKCSTCKKEIPFEAKYFLCSVSTCRHERTGYRFCSVGCWDAHLGYANHRSAFAEEMNAPSRDSTFTGNADLSRQPIKKIVPSVSVPMPTVKSATSRLPATDTLGVVSKIKQFIREQSGFNTSECCIEALTKKTVEECLKGIERAKVAGRKTVMGRDIL